MARLDLQKPPIRGHVRVNYRKQVRGYNTIPHDSWGETSTVVGDASTTVATGATAGAPGTWTPAGKTIPASVAALQAATIIATPLTRWTTGQYVQTGTAGGAGQAYWNGGAWVLGQAT